MVVCLSLLILRLPAFSLQDETPPDETTAKKLLEMSGLEEFSRILPGSFLSGLDEAESQIDPEIFPRLRLAFEQAFTTEELYAEMKAAMSERAEGADPRRLSAVLNWLDSPLSRKMVALSMDASRPDAMAKITEFGATLDEHPPPAPRWEMIQRLDEASQESRSGLDVQQVFMRALLEGSNALQPEDQRFPQERIESILEQAAVQMEQVLLQQVRVAMFYAYREVSDEELQAYTEFWGTEDGKWLIESNRVAVLRAVESASRQAGIIIGLQGVEVGPKE